MLPVYFYFIMKDMIKYTDEYSDEETHRIRSGSVPQAGTSVCLELACTTLLPFRYT